MVAINPDGCLDEEEEAPSSELPSYCVLAFYQFFTAPFHGSESEWRQALEATLRSYQARGAIRISIQEGMNGTICFPRPHQDAVVTYLQQQQPSSASPLRIRISYHTTSTFHRLSIRIKKEIVTMGPIPRHWISSKSNEDQSESDLQYVRPQRTGIYVPPGPEWDALLQDPQCLVIDTRNDYEIQMGTFVHAVSPHTQEFTEFPDWLHRQLSQSELHNYNKIAMFCTGGIRCEKATALCVQMLESTLPSNDDKGSTDYVANPIPPVYHLEGGILAYLEQAATTHLESTASPPNGRNFIGECFVFDQRVAVTYGLQPTQQYVICHACRRPVHIHDTHMAQEPPEEAHLSREEEEEEDHPLSPSKYEKGVACPACFEQNQGRARHMERQKQIELAQQRHVPHIYDSKYT